MAELDAVIGALAAGMTDAYDEELLWLVAGEYAITPVDHVVYPNRVLREAGLLAVREADDGEYLDFQQSRAFALVDHQFSHVFVADGDEQLAAHAWPTSSAASRALPRCWSARSAAATASNIPAAAR